MFQFCEVEYRLASTYGACVDQVVEILCKPQQPKMRDRCAYAIFC